MRSLTAAPFFLPRYLVAAGTCGHSHYSDWSWLPHCGIHAAHCKERNITNIKGNFEHGQYYQTVMLSLPKEGAKPIPAYSGEIHFNKDLRVIMVIYPKEGARAGKIRFVSILDRVASQ